MIFSELKVGDYFTFEASGPDQLFIKTDPVPVTGWFPPDSECVCIKGKDVGIHHISFAKNKVVKINESN